MNIGKLSCFAALLIVPSLCQAMETGTNFSGPTEANYQSWKLEFMTTFKEELSLLQSATSVEDLIKERIETIKIDHGPFCNDIDYAQRRMFLSDQIKKNYLSIISLIQETKFESTDNVYDFIMLLKTKPSQRTQDSPYKGLKWMIIIF